MRNKERLAPLYEEISRIHQTYYPDWRIGQFWNNFFRWFYNNHGSDGFYVEDDRLLKHIRKFVGETDENY